MRTLWHKIPLKNKVLRKIVDKTKIDRMTSQQIKESCGIQLINDWVEGTRREWDEQVTRMDSERLVKISRDKKMEGLNH